MEEDVVDAAYSTMDRREMNARVRWENPRKENTWKN
jgi:hypothetical protein